jgi:hypothetical protein
MYDEFGNLKKKFRAKAHRNESAEPGPGRAGWEVEHRGILLYVLLHFRPFLFRLFSALFTAQFLLLGMVMLCCLQ